MKTFSKLLNLLCIKEEQIEKLKLWELEYLLERITIEKLKLKDEHIKLIYRAKNKIEKR